jgi:serine/threonine protein kinase
MAFETRPVPAGVSTGVEDLVAGQPYRVLRRLGGGGMSTVYVVEHEVLLKHFALKVLHPFRAKDPALVDRVRVEAQAIAQLHHPNVVDVIDFFVAHDGSPCLVLELLEGNTLSEVLSRTGRLLAGEAAEIACQALSGLHAAHRIGIVHRDVKPENLFLHYPPGFPRLLKVLDFGLARVLPNAAPSAPAPPVVPTNTGAVVGSFRFMSPEAGRGERVGPAADVYSLGAVLYLMLTGRDAASGRTVRALPPSSVAPLSAAPGLDAVVLRAVEPDPSHRYESAEAFRSALLPYALEAR